MARHREPLPRLNINPTLTMQQPMNYGPGQPAFSPALPTSLPQNFYSPYHMNNPMQTPMQQSFFNAQPPPAPGRPMHHQGQPSIAHLAAAGIHPPSGFPITPLSGHFPRPSMMGVTGQPSSHPFPNRNRRQLSIGGPPKAVLGGPSRKLSPLPVLAANTPLVPPKVKKINVNLPKETVIGDDGQSARPSWARNPIDILEFTDEDLLPVESSSADPYKFDNHPTNTIEVFLPGKGAWDDMKRKAIEEKLERLGVERGSGSNVPHIHAPHARAASISSPADPALLLFKLNKLHQSQEAAASATNSLTPSPHPPFGSSFSPNRPSPRFLTNRHGHSMSLAQFSTRPFFDSSATVFDPFESNIALAPDLTAPPELTASLEGIHAPQGRAPVAIASLAPPLPARRSDSRPDFTRGFGLDIPEEEEEEVEAEEAQPVDETATASQSSFHSRHISKASGALSIRPVDNEPGEGDTKPSDDVSTDQANGGAPESMDLEDAAEEWTGSEDVCLGAETSDGEESIGEWSNPSDEERARQQRLERRMRRRASQQVDKPRRLPNFPRPPDTTIAIPLRGDDDIISNPSEEENHRDFLNADSRDYYSRPPSNLSGTSRPLPPLPHSRVASGQHSVHDPAHAHSRVPSDSFIYPDDQTQSSFAPRRDSLNPFAKPFVFGAARESDSWSSTGVLTPPHAPLMGHSRLPSIGKPLNVAAPEFKPTGFTFRPPPGVPQMPVPAPALEYSRPLPKLPSPPVDISPFKVQGREKRQRRDSSASLVEEGDSMSSFKFPQNLESPQSIRKDPTSNSRHTLNPSAEPFTFAGFTAAVATLPHVLHELDTPSVPIAPTASSPEDTLHDESTVKAENGDPHVDDFHLPSTSKPKRAPIPLDFKHPVSSNTVPAGLFKALVNGGDERTRRTVRSRLGSLEIYERQSMDDMNVPTISHKMSRSRLVTDPGRRQASPPGDVFGVTHHTRRRSSLPDTLDNDSASSASEDIPAMDLTNRMERHLYDQRLEALLEGGFLALRRDLKKEAGSQHSSTRAMISEIHSLFRTQLRDSASRSLEDSQMDARGEMDLQLFKDVVEKGNKELMKSLGEELADLSQRVSQARATSGGSADVASIVEQVNNRTISAVLEAISELSARQEAVSQAMPARERDATVDKLMTVLTPVLASLHSEPIDYDFLTSQLTQAVKPHISQLIDLASDKRETAGLIVDGILPLLTLPQPAALDTDAITLQLTTEVRRAIAPIDAFEIKEQVADLVVERLDSRLAVRDKAFNVDILTGKVTDGVVAGLLGPIQDVPAYLDKFIAIQESLTTQQSGLSSAHDHIIGLVSELPSKMEERLEILKATQADILAKLYQPAVAVSSPEPDENLVEIKNAVNDLTSDRKALTHLTDNLFSLHQNILEKLAVIPSSLLTATNVLQDSHANFLSSYDASKHEMEELRKMNTDYQIQLTKARGAHGQVRVEKDALSEKLVVMEGDRDRLRGQIKDLQTSSTVKTAEADTLKARNSELEEALAQALTRLQASDVATQASQGRIDELEKANHELILEKQSFKAKIESLDLQVALASRDRESASQALTTLQKQYDHLSSQQSHWDDLHQASEKIDMLTSLIGQADNEELKELRRHRDHSKALESEHTALQKRFKEQESKVANSERAALIARQSLAQAQQRSSDWERRAKEYEGQLDLTQTKLDQAEQTQAQLDADYSLVKLQLEEREADDRLAKNQQNKYRDHITALEAQVTRLQSELEQAKMKSHFVAPPSPYRNITNGNIHPLPRPDTRASTIHDSRSVTPHSRIQSQGSSTRSDTPPQPSVWDSMHAPSTDPNGRPAPKLHAPKSRYPNLGPSTPKARHLHYYRQAMPSPTPSTVSLAPTQGDDGWWS